MQKMQVCTCMAFFSVNRMLLLPDLQRLLGRAWHSDDPWMRQTLIRWSRQSRWTRRRNLVQWSSRWRKCFPECIRSLGSGNRPARSKMKDQDTVWNSDARNPESADIRTDDSSDFRQLLASTLTGQAQLSEIRMHINATKPLKSWFPSRFQTLTTILLQWGSKTQGWAILSLERKDYSQIFFDDTVNVRNQNVPILALLQVRL